jgi:hypothetical protein
MLGFCGPAASLGRDCALAYEHSWAWELQRPVWFWQTLMCCAVGGALAITGILRTGNRDVLGWLVLAMIPVAFIILWTFVPEMFMTIRE